ncbi:MAG: hypothetical protein WCA23_18395 [Stellaceae bacterium]
MSHLPPAGIGGAVATGGMALAPDAHQAAQPQAGAFPAWLRRHGFTFD